MERREILFFSTQFFCQILLTVTQCGKTRNLLPRNFFSSNWFTVKFFSKTLIWRKNCEKPVAVKFCHFHTVVYCTYIGIAKITKSYFHSFSKNFVKSIFSQIPTKLISRIISRMWEVFYHNLWIYESLNYVLILFNSFPEVFRCFSFVFTRF